MLVKEDSVLVKKLQFWQSMAPWCHLLRLYGPASFTVHLTDGRRVRRHLDQVRKNTFTNIIDEPSTTTEMSDTTGSNEDLPFSVLNSPTVGLPSSDVPPRASEHSEIRCTDCTS